MAKIEFAKIVKIRPTILFKTSPRGLNQIVELSIDNPRSESNASIMITYQGQRTQRMIFGIKPGQGTYQIEIPVLPETTEISFEMSLDGKLQDQYKTKLPAVRRWEIHLVHYSHHNLHYTNVPTESLKEYHLFFNRLVDYCADTAALPREARFHYTIETAWPLIHFIRNQPSPKTDELLNLIRKGQIEVAALFGNQISQIAGAEELIRLLYPAFRIKHLHKIPIETAMLNGISGLSWGLATVLADAGIRYFSPSLTALNQNPNLQDPEKAAPQSIPEAFYWESISGSKVLFWQENNGADSLDMGDNKSIEQYFTNLEEQGYPYQITRHLIASADRDNSPPSKAFCQKVDAWNKKWAFPKFVMSTNAQFFKRLEKELPSDLRTVRGELPGSIYPVAVTSSAQDVATNRQAQSQLAIAEKFAAVSAKLTGFTYPTGELRTAYEMLMLFDDHTWGQFHPFGAAHTAALAEKRHQTNTAAALAQSVILKSLNRIADQITLPDDNYHLIVFNPLSSARTDIVTAVLAPIPPTGLPLRANPEKDTAAAVPFEKIWQSCTVLGRDMVHLPEDLGDRCFEIVDLQNGETIPCQIDEITDPGDAAIDAANRFAFGHRNPLFRQKILFIARDVPAMGYKIFQLKPSQKSEVIPKKAEISVKTLENRFYRIIVATNTGGIFSIYDKELKKDIVDGFAKYRVNQIFIKSISRDKIYKLENVNIRREQRGAISNSLIITGSTTGCPQCIQEITIYNDIKRIDFTNRILKDATPLQEVYFAFPFEIHDPDVRFEGGLTVQEPLKDQFPDSPKSAHGVQRWVAFSDENLGIAWTSLDAPVVRFGDDWDDSMPAELQLIPSPKSAGTEKPKEKLSNAHIFSLVMSGNYRTGFSNTQVSDVIFRYAITSWPGTVTDGHARDFGIAQSQPLISVFMKGPQSGKLPQQAGFLNISPANIQVLTLKKAETGNDLIVRLWETAGKPTEATLQLNLGTIKSASLNNMVEEHQADLSLTSADSLTVSLKAWEIATVRIRY